LNRVGNFKSIFDGVCTDGAVAHRASGTTVARIANALLSVVKIPCGVRGVGIGDCAATTVSTAVTCAGGAGTTFAFVSWEAIAQASSTVACALVGTFAVKVSFVMGSKTGLTGITVDR
jgi:hypothetical protein